jgi:CubicO group peptidase (beta-lactamase class C family)
MSGQSFKMYAQEHIFDPLGMKNTLFYDDKTDLIKNKVFSYNKKSAEDGFDNVMNRTNLIGAGGIYLTIEDLFLWDQNFYNNKLGKGGQKIITNIYKEGRLNNGKSSGHAYGLISNNYKGLKTVENGGSFAGYRSVVLRFPDEKVSVIILANRGDANPWTMSYQLADVLLKEKFIDLPKKKENSTDNKTDNNDSSDIKEKFPLKQITRDYEIELGRLLKFNTKNDSLQCLECCREPFLMLINTQGDTYKEGNNAALALAPYNIDTFNSHNSDSYMVTPRPLFNYID